MLILRVHSVRHLFGAKGGAGSIRREGAVLWISLLVAVVLWGPYGVRAQEPSCDDHEAATAVHVEGPLQDADSGTTTLRYHLEAAAALESLFIPLEPWNWGYVDPSTSPGWVTVEEDETTGAAGLRWNLGWGADASGSIDLVLQGLWATADGTAVLRPHDCPPLSLQVTVPSHWKPAPQPTIEPAAVYGFAWHDQDGDGVWDDGEVGLDGVQITLRYRQDGADEDTLAAAVTDDSGRYTIDVPGGGQVELSHSPQQGWQLTTPAVVSVTLASSGLAGPYTFGLRPMGQTGPPTAVPTASPAPTAQPHPATPEAPPEVPEASSLTLLLAGGSALVAWWRLRRHKR